MRECDSRNHTRNDGSVQAQVAAKKKERKEKREKEEAAKATKTEEKAAGFDVCTVLRELLATPIFNVVLAYVLVAISCLQNSIHVSTCKLKATRKKEREIKEKEKRVRTRPRGTAICEFRYCIERLQQASVSMCDACSHVCWLSGENVRI